jgi:hypothetical protein
VLVRNKLGKVVAKPSYAVSINPGWSQVDALNIDTEYNPNSELWAPPIKEDVHIGSYNKFVRGR